MEWLKTERKFLTWTLATFAAFAVGALWLAPTVLGAGATGEDVSELRTRRAEQAARTYDDDAWRRLQEAEERLQARVSALRARLTPQELPPYLQEAGQIDGSSLAPIAQLTVDRVVDEVGGRGLVVGDLGFPDGSVPDTSVRPWLQALHGTVTVVRAAAEAGCERVVSATHEVAGGARDRRSRDDAPERAFQSQIVVEGTEESVIRLLHSLARPHTGLTLLSDGRNATEITSLELDGGQPGAGRVRAVLRPAAVDPRAARAERIEAMESGSRRGGGSRGGFRRGR